MTLVVDQVICRSDNFAVLVHDPASGATVAIDAPDAAVIEARLAARGWHLTDIFVTHHHGDHTVGIARLKAATGCLVRGPAAELHLIAGIDEPVAEGSGFVFGGMEVVVLDTPGHTIGHVSYHLPEARLAFVGDTLFSLGCGRVPAGEWATMWESLQKLADLPRETEFYCGHEYTEVNARYALTVEPHNLDLQARAEEAQALRAEGRPTLPSTIGVERAANPFLRAGNRRLQRAIGMEGADAGEVFAELRRRKDNFA